MSSVRIPKTDKMLKTLYKFFKKWYNIKGNTAQIDARILLAYYSVILTKFSLTCASKPASNLANLTKNLTAQSAHAIYAV